MGRDCVHAPDWSAELVAGPVRIAPVPLVAAEMRLRRACRQERCNRGDLVTVGVSASRMKCARSYRLCASAIQVAMRTAGPWSERPSERLKGDGDDRARIDSPAATG